MKLAGMKSVANYLQQQTEDEGSVVTMRPSATALLAIDSDDRYANYGVRRSNPTYPFRFSIQKNEALMNGFFKRLALTEFRLNWTIPNISAAWGNNQMLIVWKPTSGGTVTTSIITLQDGFYGAEELANELQGLIQSFIPNFSVTINSLDDDALVFQAPIGGTYFFYFQPVTTPTTAALNFSPNINANIRQLIDMINVPTTQTFVDTMNSGIPNLRAMDYFDIVCSQLSYNQELKDASSAAITRDALARIYLDDSVPSQSVVLTNNYSGTSVGTLTPTAVLEQAGNVVTFTVSATPAGIKAGNPVVVSGITGGAGWNGQGYVVGFPDTTVPYNIAIAYQSAPTGIPIFSGTPVLTFYNSLTTISVPQTSWDDRVNGVTPFVMYRQFPFPKQIRWSKTQPIGNITFELYDDQGRSIQDLWNQAYASNSPAGVGFANSFVWNANILVSED